MQTKENIAKVPKEEETKKGTKTETGPIPRSRKKRKGGPIMHKNGTTTGAMLPGVGG